MELVSMFKRYGKCEKMGRQGNRKYDSHMLFAYMRMS